MEALPGWLVPATAYLRQNPLDAFASIVSVSYHLYMQKRARIIQLMFGALSIVVAFNLNLPSVMGQYATDIGLKDPSVGRSVVIGLAVPLAIIFMSWFAVSLYQWLLWPFLGSRSGLWVYALNAHVDQDELPVAGWFRVSHTPWTIEVVEGRAYYLDNDHLTFRGEWTSDVIWTEPRRIGIVFTMIARGVTREPLPSQYQGYIQLGLRTRGTHGERALWTGYFHDLDDRRGVHGPVACTRTSKWTRARSSEELLLKHIPHLMENILELEGRKAIMRHHKAVKPVHRDANP